MARYPDYTQTLVTGGAGFLGSHLCDRLLERPGNVVCLDNFFTGSRHNVAHLLDNPRFELIRHDVTFPVYVEVDEIYNLACAASPVHYQFDPVQTTKSSVHGAINMLGLARRTRARIMQASTSEVYGSPNVHPQREDYWGHVNPIGLRACYDEGKRCAETLFFDYDRQFNLPIKVARIFNTYGPACIHMTAASFRISSVRHFTMNRSPYSAMARRHGHSGYVTDLIDGLVRLMDSPESFTGPSTSEMHLNLRCSNWRKKSSRLPGRVPK